MRAVLAEVAVAEAVGVVAAGTGAKKGATREALGFGFVLSNPRGRISRSPFKLNLPVAVARFVWMMSGNNRLSDIAFYEPMVRNFSDDDVLVPGSSYGARMLQSAPGLNQLEGVIKTLKQDPRSRRAAIAIYHPMDAIRESKDIPCTFGLIFHVRDGRLLTQIIMRSNNAWSLLQFNLFEFSLVSEVIAAELGVEPGEILHHAASMHVYDRDLEKCTAALACADVGRDEPMDAMPREPTPLTEIKKLIKFESDMRHESAAIDSETVSEWLGRANDELTPYWRQFAYLLLWAVANRQGDANALAKVEQVLLPSYKGSLPEPMPAAGKAARPRSPEMVDGLFAPRTDATVVSLSRPRERLEMLIRQKAEAYERATGTIGGATMLDVRSLILERLAARGNHESLSDEDFAAAVRTVQDRGGK